MAEKKYRLDIIAFGEKPEDAFYCLMDAKRAPERLDPDRLKFTDPRNFDVKLQEAGCLMMFTGDEVEELFKRGEADREDPESSLIGLAKAEGYL